jgi:hypothetical protein
LAGAGLVATAGLAAVVERLSTSSTDRPWPTIPASTSLTPSVPFRMVRLESAMPRAAASTSAGSASISRLAAISSWLPSRSEAARDRLASASPSAAARWASRSASASVRRR